MNTRTFCCLLVLALIWITHPVRAEDIDLFKGGDESDRNPPNILILLDNTANWSAQNQAWNKTEVTTKCNGDSNCLNYISQVFGTASSLTQGEVEVATIKLVLNELVCAVSSTTQPLKLNVGLMMLKPNKGTYSNDAGTTTDSSGLSGFIRRAVLPLNTTHCSNIISDLDLFKKKINDNDFKADASANYGGALFEAFKYFGGYTNPAGAASSTAGTPTGHISFGPLRFSTSLTIEDTLAFTSASKLQYLSPIVNPPANTCGGENFILLVGNGYPNADMTSLLSNLGFTYSVSDYPLASAGRLADVWARFLATTDVSPVTRQHPVQTYAINIYNAQPDADQTTLLKSMALKGGGRYYEVGGNLKSLVDAFVNFFITVSGRNQAFVTPTLPSSLRADVQLNQVYMGMFRPDKYPRWFGNTKLYQYAYINGGWTLADRDGVSARDSTTGFIRDTTTSFWTNTDNSFWGYRCSTSVNPFANPDKFTCGNPMASTDWPDGAVAEKGGAGQKLRAAYTQDTGKTNPTRTILTATGATMEDFKTGNANITTAMLGVSTTAERDTLINWARGVDNLGENPTVANGARPSITGDILHSGPVTVNYGASAGCSSTATGDVVVFSAGNDGMLHAIQGGESGGNELWAFLPSEFHGLLKRLRGNDPRITLPSPVPANAYNKPYMIDGPLSVYAPDANEDCRPDKVWLFMGMRRGGRFLYALDVSNKNSPTLLWRKDHQSTGLSNLGQTWAELKPITLADGTPALIFGGGYDPSNTDKPFNMATATYGTPVGGGSLGRSVFVLNAQTGAVIREFSAGGYSVPSDVAVVTNGKDQAETAFVGDTGGNLWRISFKDSNGVVSASSSAWSITQIAALGNQQFLYPPDVYKCGSDVFLLLGSGNREAAFEQTTSNNFYMIKDLYSSCTPKPTCYFTSGADLNNLSNSAPSAKGWYLPLTTGEKTTGAVASTQSGSSVFNTHIPPTTFSACNPNTGTARQHVLANWCVNGSPTGGSGVDIVSELPNAAFLPAPVTAQLKRIPENSTTPTVEEVIITSGGTPPAASTIPMLRRFTYWYREGLD